MTAHAYKEVVFRVLAPPDKGLARELTALAARTTASPLVRGAEPLLFLLGDDDVFAFPKLGGDPHNFAAYADGFIAMSAAHPGLRFQIDADGEPWEFVAGAPVGASARRLVGEIAAILRTPRERAPEARTIELIVREPAGALAEVALAFARKRTGHRWAHELPEFRVLRAKTLALAIETDGSSVNLGRALRLISDVLTELAFGRGLELAGALAIGERTIEFGVAIELLAELRGIIARLPTEAPAWIADPYTPLAVPTQAIDASSLTPVLDGLRLRIDWNEAVSSTLDARGGLRFHARVELDRRDRGHVEPLHDGEVRVVDGLELRRHDAGFALRDRATGTERLFEVDNGLWPHVVGRTRDGYVLCDRDPIAMRTTVIVADPAQLRTIALDHFADAPVATADGTLVSIDGDGRTPRLVRTALFDQRKPVVLSLSAPRLQVRPPFHAVVAETGEVYAIAETYSATAHPEVASYVWRLAGGTLTALGRLGLALDQVLAGPDVGGDRVAIVATTTSADRPLVIIELPSLAVVDVLPGAAARHRALAGAHGGRVAVHDRDAEHWRISRSIEEPPHWWWSEAIVRKRDRAVVREADFFGEAAVAASASSARALAVLAVAEGAARRWIQRLDRDEPPRELAFAAPAGYDRPSLSLDDTA